MTRRLSDKNVTELAAHLASGQGPEALKLSPPEKKRKRGNEEWRIQSDFFRWWRGAASGLRIWPGLCFHIPNGSMLGDDSQSRMIRARMLKLAGVVSGVVDCFLSVPHEMELRPVDAPWRTTWLHGCYIEFKRPALRDAKNGGLADGQQEFIGYAMARGYSCHVCYSWQEARDVTLKYLNS